MACLRSDARLERHAVEPRLDPRYDVVLNVLLALLAHRETRDGVDSCSPESVLGSETSARTDGPLMETLTAGARPDQSRKVIISASDCHRGAMKPPRRRMLSGTSSHSASGLSGS